MYIIVFVVRVCMGSAYTNQSHIHLNTLLSPIYPLHLTPTHPYTPYTVDAIYRCTNSIHIQLQVRVQRYLASEHGRFGRVDEK